MRLISNLGGLFTIVALLIIVIVVAASGCGSGQSETGIWTKFSDMQLPPDIELESPWTVEALSDTYFVYRGVLTVETVERSYTLFTHPEEGFDNNVGSTAEIKLKLLAGPATDHDASLFSLQDGTREGKISFFNDRIEIYDANTLKATYNMDTTDSFHTYRLAIAKRNFEVYADGERIASITLSNSVTNKSVVFGDATDEQGENLSAQIGYIAYSAKGAVSPEGEATIKPKGN